MPTEPATTPPWPQVRRVVLIVTAATLIGCLGADVAGRAVFAGEDYASRAPLLLTATPSAAGSGGLVVEARLERGWRMISSRDLRPAVIALVPRTCLRCGERLRDVAADVDGRGVRMYVVGSNGLRQANGIASAAGRHVVPLVDREGVLERRYRPGESATLLLVRRDGVVREIVDGVPFDNDLTDRVDALVRSP